MKDTMEVCKDYEEKLLNEENDWSKGLKVEKNEKVSEKTSVKAVTISLHLMKAGKDAGLSGITS